MSFRRGTQAQRQGDFSVSMDGLQALSEKAQCSLEQLRETWRAALLQAVLRNELE